MESGLFFQDNTSMDNGTQASNDGFILDEEFRTLLPPLNPEDFNQLEQSILEDGCRDFLVVWAEEKVLIDGHNRFAICKKHGLPFGIELKSFADRDEAIPLKRQGENQKSKNNTQKGICQCG